MMISLRSKVTIKILNYFFLNQEAERYINELANILELDPKNVHKKLVELEEEGILISEFKGKERYFHLNKNYPLLVHYRQIFLKTIGIEKNIEDVMAKIGGIKEVYIFGSYAKDQMDASSDIDVLIVGDHSAVKVQEKILPIQKVIGREINIVSMDQREFEVKKEEGFLKNIFENNPLKLI